MSDDRELLRKLVKYLTLDADFYWAGLFGEEESFTGQELRVLKDLRKEAKRKERIAARRLRRESVRAWHQELNDAARLVPWVCLECARRLHVLDRYRHPDPSGRYLCPSCGQVFVYRKDGAHDRD